MPFCDPPFASEPKLDAEGPTDCSAVGPTTGLRALYAVAGRKMTSVFAMYSTSSKRCDSRFSASEGGKLVMAKIWGSRTKSRSKCSTPNTLLAVTPSANAYITHITSTTTITTTAVSLIPGYTPPYKSNSEMDAVHLRIEICFYPSKPRARDYSQSLRRLHGTPHIKSDSKVATHTIYNTGSDVYGK